MTATDDSQQYLQRKAFYAQLLTIYGRKPVLEALQDPTLEIYRVHVAASNRTHGTMREILNLAAQRGIEQVYHDRRSLSRISKNQAQDQGIAADIRCAGYQDYKIFLQERSTPFQLIAVENITNPQNLGMIIRSVCASPLTGLLLPTHGCAPLSPLVIKASAGTLFKCRILRCADLQIALQDLARCGAEICVLSGQAQQTLREFRPQGSVVYVLGNETTGVSSATRQQATQQLCIPMHNGVESLNVAVTAALIGFRYELAIGR